MRASWMAGQDDESGPARASVWLTHAQPGQARRATDRSQRSGVESIVGAWLGGVCSGKVGWHWPPSL